MIITCECGFQDEKEIKINFAYQKKTEVVWQCENCGKIHIINVELVRSQ